MSPIGSDTRRQRRCPSINPMGLDDRCKLAADDPHEYGHEGYWKERKVAWDHSPIKIAKEDKTYWDEVEGET